ncbi:MAG: Hsp20/alpha crystallin family protein, partial [Burkholderiales bacterium]
MANLTRWDPFGDRSFGGMTQSMDELMNRFLRPRRAMLEAGTLDIAVDVSENDSTYTVKADVPGVKKEDITVSIDGNLVSISAEVKREKEEKKGDQVIREERYYGSMSRAFTLPMDVDQSKAEAQYTNGVLSLTLPKKAGSQTKKLEIR